MKGGLAFCIFEETNCLKLSSPLKGPTVSPQEWPTERPQEMPTGSIQDWPMVSLLEGPAIVVQKKSAYNKEASISFNNININLFKDFNKN